MKLKLIPSLMAGLVSFGAMAQPPATPATNRIMSLPSPSVGTSKAATTNAPPVQAPEKGQLSYAVAVYYANYMRNDLMSKLGLDPKADLDMGQFIAAYSNALAGSPMTMTAPDAIKVLQQQQAYEKEQAPEETKKLVAAGPENKVKGEKFMEDMAGKPGVTRLADGVIYTVTKEGSGVKPGTNDQATVTFRGTLIDGTEFLKVEHASIPVTHRLIPPGVTEALTLMKAGSHWMVYLPYSQGYGETPAIPDARHGFKVGPFSALIFDLELESVQARPATPLTPPPAMGGSQGMRSAGPMTMPANTMVMPPVTSSSIVRVPSAEEMQKGDKPRVLTDEEVEAAKKAAQTNAPQTNAPAPK